MEKSDLIQEIGEAWLKELYDLQSHKVPSAIDKVYSLDDYIINCDLLLVNYILKNINVKKTKIGVLLSLLTVTLNCEISIDERYHFVSKVERNMIDIAHKLFPNSQSNSDLSSKGLEWYNQSLNGLI